MYMLWSHRGLNAAHIGCVGALTRKEKKSKKDTFMLFKLVCKIVCLII